MRRATLADIWDLLLFVVLLPLLLVMGLQLPGDWANHHGASLPGTATVSALEPGPGGDVVLVDVRSASGQLVATRQEINGEAPHRLGASFPIRYLLTSTGGTTQVYTAGHDPFAINLTVFLVCLLLWLITLPFVVRRLFRLVRWAAGRRQRRMTGPYRAGRGYSHR